MLTCEHAGEEHGGEVVVEVEDPAHQEEGEVILSKVTKAPDQDSLLLPNTT